MSQEQRAEIIQLYRAGHTLKVIGEMVGMPKHTVGGLVFRLQQKGLLPLRKAKWNR